MKGRVLPSSIKDPAAPITISDSDGWELLEIRPTGTVLFVRVMGALISICTLPWQCKTSLFGSIAHEDGSGPLSKTVTFIFNVIGDGWLGWDGPVPLREPAGWMMLRGEGAVLAHHACTHTCLFAILSGTKSWGSLLGCISACQSRNLQPGVGIAGCPLLSLLSLTGRCSRFLVAKAEPLACLHNLETMLVLGKRAGWTVQGWEPVVGVQSWARCRALAVAGSAEDQSPCHCITSSCYHTCAFSCNGFGHQILQAGLRPHRGLCLFHLRVCWYEGSFFLVLFCWAWHMHLTQHSHCILSILVSSPTLFYTAERCISESQ